MRTVLSVIKRDFERLIKAPAALIVVVALIILPSLYTWINVYGFWNPYDNTENMRVCFVNEDEGGEDDLTGHLNLGEMIDDQLRQNNQLGWAFLSRDEALEEVRSGKAYAAFIVPKDFTSNLLTILSSDFKKPNIEYYVNEKLGPVSPKITDAGSTTLDETINSTFVETVSETLVNKLDELIVKSRDLLEDRDEQVLSKIESAREALTKSNSSITELENSINGVQNKVVLAKSKVGEIDAGIDAIEDGLKKVQEQAKEASSSLQKYSETVYPAISEGAIKVGEASQSANNSIKKISSDVQSSSASVNTALAQQKINLNQAKLFLEQLKNAADSLPDGETKNALESLIETLETQIDTSQTSIDNLESISKDLDDSSKAFESASNEVNTTVQLATSASISFNTTLFFTTLPALNKSIVDASTTAGKLEIAVNSQHMLVSQIKSTLNQVDTTLKATKKGLSATKKSLEIFDKEFANLQTDVSSFSLGQLLDKFVGEGGADATSIGEFLSSPTVIEEEEIYKLNAYGSAMAPLFMNLTFWIGAFMLLVILRQEVDSEGFEKLSIAQRYVARWLLLSFFSILQAILCVIGVLALGVQAINIPLLFLMSALASLAYLSLMFMLSTTLQHLGKGVCVLLAFLQIPGATGLYPIEMTTSFFQQVHPYLPFTYGINGLREAIFGIYGNTYAVCCFVLILITLASLIVGIYLRPYLTNYNKLFAKEIREGGLFLGEEIEIPTQRFRVSQLIGYIANRQEYKEQLERRAERFLRHYAKFKRYALAIVIIASTALAIAFAQLSYDFKPTLLSVWLVSLIVVMIILVAVEHAYDSIERQMDLDSLSDEDLRKLLAARNQIGKTTSEIFKKQKEGFGHRLMKRTQMKIENEKPSQLNQSETDDKK